jgi:hypothetical protein
MPEKILIIAAVMGVPVIIRGLARRYRGITGCRACAILGQVPYGLPYWLLRIHLRRAAGGR